MENQVTLAVRTAFIANKIAERLTGDSTPAELTSLAQSDPLTAMIQAYFLCMGIGSNDKVNLFAFKRLLAESGLRHAVPDDMMHSIYTECQTGISGEVSGMELASFAKTCSDPYRSTSYSIVRLGLNLEHGNEKLPHNNEDSPTPTGSFNVIVVGVSFYQAALAKITGMKLEMLVQAQIVPEQNNVHDSNAVRIEIEGEMVGHLSRENAFKWRGKMISEGFSNTVTCPAKIRWDRVYTEEGSYGVWLDIDLTLSDNIPVANVNNNQKETEFQEFVNRLDGFVFSVDEPSIQDITYLGMPVSLWIPHSKNPDNVYIYHRNGPYRPIGIVPFRYSDIIISHLQSSLNYDARIIELTYTTCKIKCKLFTKEEDEQRKEQHKASLKGELTKPYKPNKPINFIIPVKKKRGIKVGDRLIIEFEDSPSYGGPNSYPYQVKFLNQSGDTIGILDNNKSVVQRLLKAHYNSYNIDVKVLGIGGQRIWKGYPLELIITLTKS